MRCWNPTMFLVSLCRSASQAFVSRFPLLARRLVLPLVLLTRSRPPCRGQSPRRGFSLLFCRTISHHEAEASDGFRILVQDPSAGIED